MARTKRAAAPKAATPEKPGTSGIRIRMYRVGFGDFFLVTLRDQHVLIDCGVFKGTSGTGDLGSIEAAIDDMIAETGGKLALIVMTHRHADHIAGFGRFPDKFKGLTVGDVWMPVWENEYDPTAKKFQAELTAMAIDLQDHVDSRLAAGTAVTDEMYHRLGNATGDEPLAATATKAAGKAHPGGASKNKVALELLKTSLGVTPQYLCAGMTPNISAPLRAAGLTARVLGPPSVDQLSMMKLMNLKKNTAQYLAMSEDAGHAGKAWRPFGSAWETAGSDLPAAAFAEWMPSHGEGLGDAGRAAEAAAARKRLEQALHRPDGAALDVAAKALDAFLNNQSLVLLLTFAGKNLLFVGDAQGGNWEHWLYETTDPDNNPTGPLARTAKDILDSVDVYKVGHHGSTNATPKIVAESIREGAVAMCSTQHGVFGESETTEVPLGKLMTALGARTKLVRADQIPITVAGKAVATIDPAIDHATFTPGAYWVDYSL